jgi:hypothetical protein
MKFGIRCEFCKNVLTHQNFSLKSDKNGSIMFLQNIGNYLPDYTALTFQKGPVSYPISPQVGTLKVNSL